MEFRREALDEALRALGAVLAERRTPHGVLVVGGSSLLLLRLIDRPTGDVDVIALVQDGHYRKVDALPDPLSAAAASVARGLDLAPNRLNTGPSSLMDDHAGSVGRVPPAAHRMSRALRFGGG